MRPSGRSLPFGHVAFAPVHLAPLDSFIPTTSQWLCLAVVILGPKNALPPIRAVDAEAFVRYSPPMSATTYKTWDDVPEELQGMALMKGLEVTETEEELAQFMAKELGIPRETIPPGEMVTK